MRCTEGEDKQTLPAALLMEMERALSRGHLRGLVGGGGGESEGPREPSGANCQPHTWHRVGAQDTPATVPMAGRVWSHRAGRGLAPKGKAAERLWRQGAGWRGTLEVSGRASTFLSLSPHPQNGEHCIA